MLAWSVLSLVAAYGAWNLKKWSWSLLVGLEIFSILQNLALMSGRRVNSFVGIVIAGGILYYLFQVKTAFTK